MSNEDEETALVNIEDVTTPIDPPHESMIRSAQHLAKQLRWLDEEIYGMETTLANLKKRRDADARYLGAVRDGISLWSSVKMNGEDSEH